MAIFQVSQNIKAMPAYSWGVLERSKEGIDMMHERPTWTVPLAARLKSKPGKTKLTKHACHPAVEHTFCKLLHWVAGMFWNTAAEKRISDQY